MFQRDYFSATTKIRNRGPVLVDKSKFRQLPDNKHNCMYSVYSSVLSESPGPNRHTPSEPNHTSTVEPRRTTSTAPPSPHPTPPSPSPTKNLCHQSPVPHTSPRQPTAKHTILPQHPTQTPPITSPLINPPSAHTQPLTITSAPRSPPLPHPHHTPYQAKSLPHHSLDPTSLPRTYTNQAPRH